MRTCRETSWNRRALSSSPSSPSSARGEPRRCREIRHAPSVISEREPEGAAAITKTRPSRKVSIPEVGRRARKGNTGSRDCRQNGLLADGPSSLKPTCPLVFATPCLHPAPQKEAISWPDSIALAATTTRVAFPKLSLLSLLLFQVFVGETR